MKRLITVSNDGDAYLCDLCGNVYAIAYDDPVIRATAVAGAGLRHLATHHAAEWLEHAGWTPNQGHSRVIILE